MRLSPLVTTIVALDLYLDVGGAVDMAAALEGRCRPPAAYVIPARETAGANRTGTRYPITQRVEHEVQVVSVLDWGRAAAGGDAIDALALIRAPLIAGLARWTHPDADGPTRHIGGQLVSAFDGDDRIWWGDRFLLTHTRRITLS